MNPFKKAKTNTKRSFAKATGIPTTKSGRSRKANKIKNQFLGWIIIIILIIYTASNSN